MWWFRARRVQQERDAEIEACRAMLVDRYIERGLSREEALRTARLELEEPLTEQTRAEHTMRPRMRNTIESSLQDARYAWRALRKGPAFTAIAVLTLALGIGVNTAIFSVVYAVLLRPLPYNHPEQLAFIWSSFKSASSRAPTSGPALYEIQHRSRLAQDVAAIWVGSGTFTGDVNPEQVKVAFVTTNFLQMLGTRPALGRVFRPDEQFNGPPAIVLSYGLWQRRFGGDPSIVGKGVAFQGESATVLGVLPQDFQLYFPQDSNVPPEIGVFFPFQNWLYQRPRTLYFLRVLERMKPGVSLQQAQADMNQVASQMRGAYTEFANENLKLEVAPMQRDVVRDLRTPLIALFAGSAFVLLICSVNIANLLLARANGRRQEIAVRCALGASQGRILRQLFLEGMLLCALAGAAGIALGWAALRGLLTIRPDYLARMPHVELNWPVLAFVAAVSLACAFVFGLAPSFESAKSDLIGTLREAGRSSQTPARRGVSALLIVGEITLGFVLVIGAGLMIRTLTKIQQVNPGFDAQRLLTFELDLNKFDPPDRINFVRDWESKLATLPGVDAVGGVSHLPLDDYSNWYSPYRPDGVAQSAATTLADYRAITPGYLRAMGTRLLEGRVFDDRDRAETQQVVLVDDMLARSAWPGESAVGKKIETEHFTRKGVVPVWAEVVGVVEHVHNHSLSKRLRAEVYIPFTQTPREHMTFAVRTRMDPSALAGTIRQELQKRDKDLALSKLRPMTTYLEHASAPVRFTAVLAGIFAALALLLAAIGIYGVISYSVSRRMHEMGVRMALGATSSDVLRLVMREGLVLTAAGMLLGTVGALFVSRALESLIYGISAVDPVSYAIAVPVIALAAMLGCWRPAAKAASANPVDALRMW
jgi:putative ABC transport system permease protein